MREPKVGEVWSTKSLPTYKAHIVIVDQNYVFYMRENTYEIKTGSSLRLDYFLGTYNPPKLPKLSYYVNIYLDREGKPDPGSLYDNKKLCEEVRRKTSTFSHVAHLVEVDE